MTLAARPSPGYDSGALGARDLERGTFATTVQSKHITFPTDAKLVHVAIRGPTACRVDMEYGCASPICG